MVGQKEILVTLVTIPDSMQRHVQRHHSRRHPGLNPGNIPASILAEAEPSPPSFCEQCGNPYMLKSSLARHLKTCKKSPDVVVEKTRTKSKKRKGNSSTIRQRNAS